MSLIHQSYSIDKIIVVDDGSSDDTGEIVTQLCQKHANLKLVVNHHKDQRATGAKIVKAFNLGLASVDHSQFDLVSKFDADLEFPTHYIEEITAAFEADERLGLCGGYCLVNNGDKWQKETVAKNDHIRGALKSYRVSAFNQMDGLKLFMGWDSADEFHLRFNGWKIKLLKDLNVKHYRKTNSLNGWVKTARLNAEVFHNLGYGIIIGTFSCLKRMVVSRPFILNGVYTLFYFFKLYIRGRKPYLSKEVVKSVRAYRWSKILRK